MHAFLIRARHNHNFNGFSHNWDYPSYCCCYFALLSKFLLLQMLSQEIFCSFYPSRPTSLHYCPQLIHFSLKISYKMEKIASLDTFICLGTVWICSHYLTPKNVLRTKMNFFHVCKFHANITEYKSKLKSNIHHTHGLGWKWSLWTPIYCTFFL